MTLAVNIAQSGSNNVTFRNKIINGGMVIDQRYAGAVQNPANGYIVDRWNAASSVAGKFKAGQNLNSVTPPAGFTNYFGIQSLSAYSVGSSDYFSIYQPVEGYNVADIQFANANCKTTTLSFWVYSSLTGNFGGSVQDSTEAVCFAFTYSIPVANTWTYITVNILPYTGGSGTWSTTNGVGCYVWFGLGAGSGRTQSTTGAWTTSQNLQPTGTTSVVGTNTATFYITGVQLEAGTTASPFEYRQYGTELALCQRYYFNQDTASNALYGGLYNSSTRAIITVPFHATMRTNPSCTATYGGDCSANSFFSTKDVCYVYCNTVGNAGYLSSFTASAEL